MPRAAGATAASSVAKSSPRPTRAELPPVNKVLLFGLLHHLSDEQSPRLLRLSAQTLAPGGVVISVDPCFEPSQGRISHWMSANDRGEFVRTPEQFTALANRSFGEIDGEIWNQVTRIPSSHWMMRCRRRPSPARRRPPGRCHRRGWRRRPRRATPGPRRAPPRDSEHRAVCAAGQASLRWGRRRRPR